MIEYSLTVSHITRHFVLNLRSDLCLDILLQPSQHEGLEHQMKSSELMLIKLALVIERVTFDIFREPFLELFVTVEKFWHNEVKQSPKLGHTILDGSTS